MRNLFKDRRNWPAALLLLTIFAAWSVAIAQQGNQIIPSGASSTGSYGTVLDATKFGVQSGGIIYDASFSTSKTISFPNNDCPTTAQPGWIVFGVSSAATFQSIGSVTVPQGVLAAGSVCTSGTGTITVPIAATANCTPSLSQLCALVFGPDNSTALTNFWNAAVISQCTSAVLPQGVFLTQTAQFNANSTTPGFCRDGAGNFWNGPSISGNSSYPGTQIVPTPNFAFSSCSGGLTDACFFGSTSIFVHDLIVNGAGNGVCAAAANAKSLVELQGGAQQSNAYMQNVVLAGWCGTTNSGTAATFGLRMAEASMVGVHNTWVVGFGSTACGADTLLANEYVNWYSGACVSGQANPCGLNFNANGIWNDFGGLYGNCDANTTVGLRVASGTFNGSNTQVAQFFSGQTGTFNIAVISGATMNCTGCSILNNLGTGTAISLQGNLNLLNTNVTATGAGGVTLAGVSTGLLKDLGGNTFTTTAANTLVQANVGGSNAISTKCTGTATSSVTLFLPGFGDSTADTCTITASTVGFKVPAAGKILGLFATAGTAGFAAGSGVITIVKNGTNQTMTCTIGTGTTCNDQTVSHYVTVAQGDIITLSMATVATETLANATVTLWLAR